MANAGTYNHTKQHFAEGSAADTPDSGEVVIYAKTDGLVYSKDDAGAETLMSSGAALSNPMTTAGDIIYSSDGSGTPARLAAGTDGHVLTLASGVPSWAAGSSVADIGDLGDVTVTGSETDGQVLTSDGAGGFAFEDAAASGGGLVDHGTGTRTAGNLTLNSASFADVNTGTDITVDASTGDLLLITMSALVGAENTALLLDVATIVSSSPVNYVSGGVAEGLVGWYGPPGQLQAIGGSVVYAVQAGDISTGTVTLRLRYKTTTATNKTLYANSNQPLRWSVVNLG